MLAVLREKIQAVGDLFRAAGPAGALVELPLWTIRRAFVVLELSGEGGASTAPIDGLRVARLGEGDLSALQRLFPVMTGHEVRRRWSEGQVCTIGWVGCEPAYYRWDTTRPVHLAFLGKTFHPGPGEFLTTEARTHDRFRRLGVARAVTRSTLQEFRAGGRPRRVTLVACWNRPSLRFNVRVASRIVGTVGYWNLGVRRRYFATGAVRLEGSVVSIATPPGEA
jgi:hypothetical protein